MLLPAGLCARARTSGLDVLGLGVWSDRPAGGRIGARHGPGRSGHRRASRRRVSSQVRVPVEGFSAVRSAPSTPLFFFSSTEEEISSSSTRACGWCGWAPSGQLARRGGCGWRSGPGRGRGGASGGQPGPRRELSPGGPRVVHGSARVHPPPRKKLSTELSPDVGEVCAHGHAGRPIGDAEVVTRAPMSRWIYTRCSSGSHAGSPERDPMTITRSDGGAASVADGHDERLRVVRGWGRSCRAESCRHRARKPVDIARAAARRGSANVALSAGRAA